MAATSTKVATTKAILKPVTTLKGHGGHIPSISYFPDGQRMISRSLDNTARQWDLKTGKEIEEARGVCEEGVWAVAVSRDSRWIVTGGGDDSPELKTCEVETGIVKTFEGHSKEINSIDISTDSTLMASGADDGTVRIWDLDTGKLVAGPFGGVGLVGAVRFSSDAKKLAIKFDLRTCLEVWDVQKQKLDVSIGKPVANSSSVNLLPVFWTNNNKTIIASFNLTPDSKSAVDLQMIYEFDASTLETVGAPFEGHSPALSFDGTLLASIFNNTIKLWAFESRQLLASFNVQDPDRLILSPDSRQLAYTTYTEDDYKICICDTPPNILAQARTIARKKATLNHLLNSNATRRPPAGHRRPPISAIPMAQRSPPTIHPQQPTFVRLRKLLHFSPRKNAVPPAHHVQPRDPLDFSATLPLPRPLSGHTTTQSRSGMNSGENSRPLPTTRSSATSPATFSARIHHLSTWWPVRGGHAQPHLVDVPLAQAKERNAAAGAPKKDEDIVPDEYFDPPSPNPDSQQPAAAVQPATGEHGGDRFCFCF